MTVPAPSFDPVALTAERCRASFKNFVKAFWNLVPGTGGHLDWSWHLDVFCEELQKIAERVFRREPAEYDVVCNVSPGTSKSTLWSILFPPWVWTRMPQARFMTASHTESLVLDLANKSRDVLRSEKYRQCFPEILLVSTQDAKGHFRNSLGGDRYACTVGGKSPIGMHGHFLIGDDLLDPQKALSEAEMKTAREFVENTLATRMVDKRVSVMAIVMQRLGKGDSTDVVLEIGRREGARPVRHICLPAELLGDGRDLVFPPEMVKNYQDGLMDPVRLPRYVLNGYRARGNYYYSAQFLQNPTALGGGQFRREWFSRRAVAAPYRSRRIRYVDRASTEGGGCHTAMVLMAYDGENFFVEDVVRGQWEPDRRNAMILATALKDRSRYGPRHEPMIWVESEGGSTAKDANKGLARVLKGFPVFFDRVTGSKDVRAEPWASQLAVGNVLLVDNGEHLELGKASWDIGAFIDEHLNFRPDVTSRHVGRGAKDQVDAASRAHSLLADDGRTTPLRTMTFRPEGKRRGPRLLVCRASALDSLRLDQRALVVVVEDPPVTKEVVCSGAGDVGEQSLGEVLPGGDVTGGAGHCVNSLPDEGGMPVGIHETDGGDLSPTPVWRSQCLDAATVRFADLDPAEVQDRWGRPLEPWGTPPEALVMLRDHGKQVWSLILRKRDPGPDTVVFADNGDRRALSLAMGVCDVLGMSRSVVRRVEDPEDAVGCEGDPPNRHVYEQCRASRGMVL